MAEGPVPSAPPLTRAASMDDTYECPICRELLYRPVTLLCGHTSCERCVAEWVVQRRDSESMKCPAGCATNLPRVVPRVNLLLQQKLERSFANDIAVRKAAVDRLEAASPVLPNAPRYETGAAGAPAVPRNRNRNRNNRWEFNAHAEGAVLNGVANLRIRLGDGQANFRGSLCLSVFLWILGWMFVGVSLTRAPPSVTVSEWSQSDVVDWLNSANLQSAVSEFERLSVDGTLLVEFEEDDFVSRLELPAATAIRVAKAHDKLMTPEETPKHAPKGFWAYRLHHRYFTTTCGLLVYAPRVLFLLAWWRDSAVLYSILPSAVVSLPMVLLCPFTLITYCGMLLTTVNPILAFGLVHTGVSHQPQDWAWMRSQNIVRDPVGTIKHGLRANAVVFAAVGVLLVTYPFLPWMVSDVLLYTQVFWVVAKPLLSAGFLAGGADVLQNFFRGFFNAWNRQ